MALWIFQMFFNLIVAALAVGWLLERRRSRGRVATQEPHVSESPSPALETPLRSPISTLKERPGTEAKVIAPTSSAAEAYDKADGLLSQGIPLREVARQTGLSLAELQLIGKMSQKNQ